MAVYRKKIIAFMLLVALSAAALLFYPVKSTASEQQKPVFGDSHTLFANDPNFPAGSGNNLSTRELFFKMMLSVLLVIVLGTAAVYVSRRFCARMGNLPGKSIRIIETVHIGPRKTVYLLKAGGRRLLIGSTGESITMLADVTDELGDLTEKEG